MVKTANHYLYIIQLCSFSILLVYFTLVAQEAQEAQEGMGLLLLFITTLLFMPFVLISIIALLNRAKYENPLKQEFGLVSFFYLFRLFSYF